MGKMKVRKLIILIFWLIFSIPVAAERLLDPMPVTMVAQDFSLPSVSGDLQTLKQLKGSYVLVNFWSADCLICVAELSVLQDLYEQLQSDYNFEIVAVHAGPKQQEVGDLLKTNPVTYHVVMDNDLKMGHWGIPQLPTSYIVTPDGNFAYRAVGTRLWNSPHMVDFLREVMNGKESSTLQ